MRKITINIKEQIINAITWTKKYFVLKSDVINNVSNLNHDNYPCSASVVNKLYQQVDSLNTKITVKILYDGNWSGLHIKVFHTLDGIFFGVRGTLNQTLAAGTKYQINAPNMMAMLSGSIETQNGMRGYVETDTGKIYITPTVAISGWVIASGVLIYGL